MKAAKKYEMHVALHMKSLYNVFVTAACSYAPGMPRRPSKKSSNFQRYWERRGKGLAAAQVEGRQTYKALNCRQTYKVVSS